MSEKVAPTTLKAAEAAWLYTMEDYAAGHAHKAAGKPIAWSCTMVEKDIYRAMGVHGFYPENYAGQCAYWRKTPDSENEAVRFARIAEQHGYSTDLCGYERAMIGYIMTGNLSDAPFGGMPAPDLLVTTSSVCDLRLKWWEDMAQRFKVPLFTLDRPDRIIEKHLELPKPHELRYYRSQLVDLISFISAVTGAKYDDSMMEESLDWSYKSNELRLEIMKLLKAVPSPMGVGDQFASYYPAVYGSGSEKGYRYVEALREEIKARVKAGQGQIEDERFRLLWSGAPTWYNYDIYRYFEPLGGVFVYNPTFSAYPWPPPGSEDPLTELALRTLVFGTEYVRMTRTGFPELLRNYRVDGVVCNSCFTCPPMYDSVPETMHILEEFDIPAVFMESDIVDERSFSFGQIRTRLDALGERVLLKKGIRS